MAKVAIAKIANCVFISNVPFVKYEHCKAYRTQDSGYKRANSNSNQETSVIPDLLVFQKPASLTIDHDNDRLPVIIHHSFDSATNASRSPLIPVFVLVFVLLAAVNSFGMVTAVLSDWLLVVAIGAVGMKTSLKELLSVGRAEIGLIAAETLFSAAFVLTGICIL